MALLRPLAEILHIFRNYNRTYYNWEWKNVFLTNEGVRRFRLLNHRLKGIKYPAKSPIDIVNAEPNLIYVSKNVPIIRKS